MADGDLGEWLKREWFAGRAQLIFGELHTNFRSYMSEVGPERRRELLDAADDDMADTTKALVVNQAVAAEGILAAVAVYLARNEASSPVGD